MPKRQKEIVATLRLHIRIKIIHNVYPNNPTDYLSCDLMRSKFLDISLLRQMVEKTVCNDYQIRKWTSCIVKGCSYPSFETYTFEHERTIVAEIQK